jgi:sugar phosphate isomerase/epimerase
LQHCTDEACKKAGIGFAYYNHDEEFRAVEGKYLATYFLTQTKVKRELDVAWAIKGGKNPVDLFKQNPGRFPLWHIKDLDATGENILQVGKILLSIKPFLRPHQSPE